MNDLVNNTLEEITPVLFKENLEDKIQNEITTCKNISMVLKNDYSLIYDEIHKNGNNWTVLINKNDEYDTQCKEKEKYSFDIMYVDGEIQFANTKINTNKEQISEMEKLIQEAFVKLKELEYEKNLIREKLIDKHNAFKKATKYYKTLLDVYIHVEMKEDIFYATVCYFTQNMDDTYSFVISKNDKENKWALNGVKPQLDVFQFTALQRRFNNSNNISTLLYTVRQILMMYKNSRK